MSLCSRTGTLDFDSTLDGIVKLSSDRRVWHTRRMNAPAPNNRYKNYRFPFEIISHAVWLYYRFCLSSRDMEELLLARGGTVTYEAIRKWCRTFGQAYANQLRRRPALSTYSSAAITRRTNRMTAPHSALMPLLACSQSLAKAGICGPFLGGTRRRETGGVSGGNVAQSDHMRRESVARARAT
jgi:hypothetical protein